MPQKEILVEGERWRVTPLPEMSKKRHASGDWHLVRVRFDPISDPARTPRATWLRCEHATPAHDLLAQYGDEELVEAFLASEELQI